MRLKYYLRGLGIGMLVTAGILMLSGNHTPAQMSDAQVIARAKELGMTAGTTLESATADSSKETAKPETQESGQTEAKDVVRAPEPEKEDASANTTVNKKTDTQASVEADAKAETKADGKEDTKADDKTDTKADNKTDAKADNKTDAKTEAKVDNKTDSKADGKTDAKADDKTDAKTEAKADSKPDAKNDTKAEKTETVVVTVYPGEGSYTVSKKLATLGLVESADIFDSYLCQNDYDNILTTGNHVIRVGAGPEEIAKALTGRK